VLGNFSVHEFFFSPQQFFFLHHFFARDNLKNFSRKVRRQGGGGSINFSKNTELNVLKQLHYDFLKICPSSCSIFFFNMFVVHDIFF
jgi:hypothetical protein